MYLRVKIFHRALLEPGIISVSVSVQTNPTYIAQQQAFVDSTLSASKATYNLVVVSSYPLYHSPGARAIAAYDTFTEPSSLAHQAEQPKHRRGLVQGCRRCCAT